MDAEWEPYIMGLRSHQVLAVNTYKFISSSGTHQQFTQFHIRPRMDIPDEYHSSPIFLRHQWNENSAIRRPNWMQYINHPPGTTSWSVYRLSYQVPKCEHYAGHMGESIGGGGTISMGSADDLRELSYSVPLASLEPSRK
ncbi:hypothetical protein MSAN_01743900 [Mycena sanguinolenta]|uniref:Uncharacterized protein n=1 Tax=Mycena sanguinolenta TaxID=230812 RepID=A0A8H6Y0G3_9AGAR|nr:hypothetical protein MSAN_01743900 [Mycena sanguinolenta]